MDSHLVERQGVRRIDARGIEKKTLVPAGRLQRQRAATSNSGITTPNRQRLGYRCQLVGTFYDNGVVAIPNINNVEITGKTCRHTVERQSLGGWVVADAAADSAIIAIFGQISIDRAYNVSDVVAR